MKKSLKEFDLLSVVFLWSYWYLLDRARKPEQNYKNELGLSVILAFGFLWWLGIMEWVIMGRHFTFSDFEWVRLGRGCVEMAP